MAQVVFGFNRDNGNAVKNRFVDRNNALLTCCHCVVLRSTGCGWFRLNIGMHKLLLSGTHSRIQLVTYMGVRSLFGVTSAFWYLAFNLESMIIYNSFINWVPFDYDRVFVRVLDPAIRIQCHFSWICHQCAETSFCIRLYLGQFDWAFVVDGTSVRFTSLIINRAVVGIAF
jgi:hypothetical protein